MSAEKQPAENSSEKETGKSFTVVAVPSFVGFSILGTAFTAASGVAGMFGMSGQAAAWTGAAGTALAWGAAGFGAGVAVVVSYLMLKPREFSKGAGLTGLFTGLAAAGALTAMMYSGVRDMPKPSSLANPHNTVSTSVFKPSAPAPK